jgi:DHA1 family tetracycline resistance protein-like MFS transporter
MEQARQGVALAAAGAILSRLRVTVTKVRGMKTKRALGVILTTVALDAVGVGLVLPIIPRLLREVGHTSDLGWRFGAFLALYALMQFACAPILGAFSDRFGRRPVLLASLAGAAIDYLFLALAPSFWWLFVGRAIAGLTGASGAVASAYIADISPAEHLTRRFGYMSACFGLGFIAGPVIGGVLGDIWVRAPFLAAAVLNGLNFLVALLVLPESHQGRGGKIALSSFNPLGPMRWAFGFPALAPLLAAFVILAVVGEVGGTIWVLYGEDRFAWNGLTIGVSLAGFGLFHALAQAFVAGPISERWGEKRALAIGIVADAAAYVAIALASRGWMAFLLLPLFCLGGVGGPALQSLLSSRAGEAHQGRLQGVLASLTGLSSVIAPLLISQVYFASRGVFPGLVWLAGAALYLLCLPVYFSQALKAPRVESA